MWVVCHTLVSKTFERNNYVVSGTCNKYQGRVTTTTAYQYIMSVLLFGFTWWRRGGGGVYLASETVYPGEYNLDVSSKI